MLFLHDMENTNNIVYSKNVIEFVAVASEYCNLIETGADYTPKQLLDIARKLLPLLYFKISTLPPVEPVFDDELEKYVNELDYNALLMKWSQKLGEHDLYHEVIDPQIQFGTEPVTASISENLLDIYQDVKDFISSYSFGNEEVMNDALAACIGHFNDFWGQQLVNVFRAIHQLCFSDIDWNEPDWREGNISKDAGQHEAWIDRFFNQE